MVLLAFDESGDSASSLPAIVFFLFVGFVVFCFAWSNYRRRQSMRELASVRGLDWLSRGLPGNFPRTTLNSLFPGRIFGGLHSARNDVGVQDGADYLLAFDVSISRGKGSSSQTVIARRSLNLRPATNLPPGYLSLSAGGWRVVTPQPKVLTWPSLVQPAVIERLWDLLR